MTAGERSEPDTGTPELVRHRPWSRQQRSRVLWPVVGLVVAASCALVVVGLGAGDLSDGAVATATVLALVPVVLVVGAFLWLDRWEPEPGRTLIAAFLWGAGGATLGAVTVNSVVAVAYGDVTSSVVSAPLSEEAFKGAFLVAMLVWRRRELDGAVDGIVYAGLVAAGFAFVENILYLARAFDADAADGYAVFVVRGLMSPFAHPLFTVFIGVAVGMAARRRRRARRLLPLLGYLLAVGLHALWNASALWDDGADFFLVYVVFMVPVFAAMLGLALWQRRRERRTVAAQLGGLVAAGWVPWYEADLLSTLRSRRRWVRSARAGHGRRAARAVRAYQVAVTELAFVTARIEHGAAGPHAALWRAEVLASVSETRAAAAAATS
ncbi:RsiW-degrading membrane proteinase PrsW (M82 family) [Haloactinopolyspora alba]|uniref:RsiW-degrading membrane proteinase PrsW (M82 family) n=1 Tax=Haloactinopolyspora alba TaxID=648780 RepID=A0A2P8DV61_9ACTN|nr:PrsW family intramembrane metalloprotease [Haloactinopolyspora alba]PSL01100.1 RsiW-degrading membrane proteinase PrsW (M82 family) [Haloactinopolyspora alba]